MAAPQGFRWFQRGVSDVKLMWIVFRLRCCHCSLFLL
jgi:hypothetical protein